MENTLTPLSRRQPVLAIPVLLMGLFFILQLIQCIRSPLPISMNNWGGLLWLAVFLGIFAHKFVFPTVTDYDANYLYVFKRTGTESIPLGSFYKLRPGRGYWTLYYRDEQARKKTLFILPLNTGFFRDDDNSIIHGFIDAVGQHNPQLDVRHGWFR